MARLGLFLALLLSCQVCLAQQPSKTSQASLMDLHGPVHTVVMQIVDYTINPKGTSAGSRFSVYDPEGYILEESRYDPQGSLMFNSKCTRSGWQVSKVEHMSAAPGDSSTTLQSFDADGLVAGIDTYDGNDTLISHTVNGYERNSDGTQVSTSEKTDADGSVSSTKTFDSPTHELATKNGKPYSESFIQRDPDGKPLHTVIRFTDGSYSQRTMQPDGVTVRNYWSQTKTKTYLSMDAQGHWLETIEESPDKYVKTKCRYDDAGRRIEVTTYDGSGKLVSKLKSEYQDDANGSWIEEKDFTVSGDKPPKLSTIRRRTITYY